jgi:glycosyltransferase involved in cell wall biosynthesis
MAKRKTSVPLDDIAFISDYSPRQCGIATFTTDLRNAIAGEMANGSRADVLAMDDIPEGYRYPSCVKFQVRANLQADYLRGAEFINVNQYDLAIMQHEFGIYGGPNGAYALRLIQALRMPVMSTMHTILQEPVDEQRRIVQDLGRLCAKIVVMSHKAQQMLLDLYKLPEEKVAYIPHGIPDLPFSDTRFYKDQFNLAKNKVILTFGLLSPGKGIEYMIEAMARIVQQHPEAVYIVLGATHPNVLRETGDAYRNSLQQRVHKLGLDDHVIFRNQFVELEELCQYLGAADVYAIPYLNEAQITSGTLAYAMGSGTAVVSTPFWHAEELLADGRGRLVPFRDADAFAEHISELLGDDDERHRVRRAAYEHTRPMVWKQVARQYLDLAHEVLEKIAGAPLPLAANRIPARIIDELPEVDLQHMRRLTDDTGIAQHAIYSVVDRDHGYCTDDNARAMIVAGLYHELQRDETAVDDLIHNYLGFLQHAFNPDNGRFRNFMSYGRQWLEDAGSEDSHGRAMWSLGVIVRTAPHDSLREMATRLFSDALPAVLEFAAPRSWAFTLIGLHEYLTIYGGDSEARRIRNELAKNLHQKFKDHATEDWPWFEDIVAYSNAKVPQALLLAGQWIPDPQMYETGLKALRWLIKLQTAPDGHLSVIGNEQWMRRDGTRSHFAQQAVDVQGLIEACVEAFRSNGEKFWLDTARRCFEWFLGRNDLNTPMYDFKTGGCHDGLELHGPNQNQGAESSLAWLISLLTMHKIIGQEMLVDEQQGLVGQRAQATARDEPTPKRPHAKAKASDN